MYGRLNGDGLPIHAPTHSAQDPVPSCQYFHKDVGAPGFRAHMGYPPADGQRQAFSKTKEPPSKPHRATQACNPCRARKAKCDEGRPNCSHCLDNELRCVYNEAPPPKQEKTTQLVLDRLSQIESRMEERAIRTDEHFAKCQEKMQELMHFNLARGVLHPPPTVPEHPALPPPQPKVSLNVLGASKFGQKLPPMGPRIDQKEAEGELSIPVEHTTAAHKLLMWPSIKRLLHPAKYDEDYVMRLEEERGLISIYGQGEISYTADNSQLPMECGSKGAQPNGNGAGPDANVDIDELGNLDLDATTARRYYDSYFERIFKLHPFLMEGELRIKVDRFIRHYCRLNNSPPSSVSSYTRPARDGPPPAKKRQSNENLSVRDELTKIISSSPRPRVGKNIDNALVLLCLALGAICEAPAPLPGPVMDKIDYLNQPIPASLTPLPSPPPANTTYVTDANGVLPPANSVSAAMQMPLLNLSSVPAQPAGQNVSNISSNNDIEGLSRRDATNTQDKQGNTRNYLAIPGLALYGYATAILGHLQGGNELEHVQCGLLAGLYAGQLAHPFQSHSWISQASRACQILVRIKRYEQLDEGATKDLYNFAFWTCLQLESDLLAELDVPASGISRSEGRIPIPKGKWTIDLPNDLTAPNTMMMLFYSAQIHLRKLLDRVHTDLYKVDKQEKTRWSSTVQKTLSWNLDLWRESLPKSMQWDESDPPANEINAARMRAKYYGARYIIHRPLLYDALHWQEPKVHFHELPEELRAACVICIESAIKSTEAFDGVGGHRLVVTNIFGTAHAQFGNMLVLSATYISSLKELVEPEQLKRLLARTIWFLIQNENISPTLRADARILTEIYMKIFSEPPDLRQGTRMSFL